MSLQISNRIRTVMFSVGVLCCGFSSPAPAQLSIDVGVPSAGIGLHIQQYPNLVPVPRYPVYYARGLDSNLFFYDGQYWVYAQDNWYTSTWYNGPWDLVPPETVPDFILRIPLLYYRRPPPYFSGWDRRSPPHWGEHWGREWEDRRRGWNHWDRNEVPRRAPPPVYQRHYPQENYPHVDEQQALRERNYRHEPGEDLARGRSDRLQGGAMDPNRTKEPNRLPAARQRPDAPPRNSARDRQPQTPRNDAERRDSPPPPAKKPDDANRAVPGRLIPRHGNPQIPQRQGRPEPAERPPKQNPSKPPTRKLAG